MLFRSTGFPWLTLGYSSAGWPLQGYAPIGGVYAVSFLILSVAGMLYLLVLEKRFRLAVAAIALLGAGEGLRHVAWNSPEGEPVNAALLQGNIEQEMKFRPERYARILETYARLAEGTSARLIVLPETAVPRFLDQVDPAYLGRLQAAARRNNGDLLLGVPFRARDRYYNSVVSLGTAPLQTYHKSHLVPLGEFVPPGFGWILDVLSIPMSDFDRGASGQALIAAAGQRIAVNVCYEDAFGEIGRAHV